MVDPLEDVPVPVVVEKAMVLFESLGDRDRAEIVQARKAVTEYVYGLMGQGNTDEKRLLASAPTYLKSRETRHKAVNR
jgi:hypothetical protein